MNSRLEGHLGAAEQTKCFKLQAIGDCIVSKMKQKASFANNRKMVSRPRTGSLALAVHLTGRKHNTLPANLCIEAKTNGYHKNGM